MLWILDVKANIILRILFILNLSLCLSACSQDQDVEPANHKIQAIAPEEVSKDTLAIVNGRPIKQAIYILYAQERAKQNPPFTDNHPKTILNELINIELVLQQAEAQQLEQRHHVTTALEYRYKSQLTKEALKDYLLHHPISEAQVQSYYQQQIHQMDLTEYQIAHILTDSHIQAQYIIKELKLGKDFGKLAQKYSLDCRSAKRQGLLNWYRKDQMLPNFAQIIPTLKKGEYSNLPSKSQFGWHIILLKDTRQGEPPDLASVRKNIINLLQQQQVDDYITQLKQQANIKIYQLP